MTRPTSTPAAPTSTGSRRWFARRPLSMLAAGFSAGALLLTACGGGSDGAAETTAPVTTAAEAAAPTTRATTTTAAPTTTTTIAYVTEGATVVVANASNVNGSAGRMTERLAEVGFTTGTATNSTEGQLSTTKIYFDATNASAEAVANSLAEALGGGDITVSAVGTPPPVDQPDELGDATVIVAMGNDTADKTLEELQGLVASDDSEDDEGSDESDAADTTEADDTTATTEEAATENSEVDS